MRFKKIYVEITNRFNLSCDFCIKNNRKIKDIEIESFKEILTKIKPYTNYLYLHVLGEPLLHKNINELIDIAYENKFNINITTNGYLINNVKYNKNIRQINISLHSYNEKYKISLDDYLNNIFDSIDELIKNKTYISLRLWLKNKYTNEIINVLNKKYKIINNKVNDYLYINYDKEFIWPDLNNDYYSEKGTCYGLIDHIGILVDGTIIPCCLDSKDIINLGNIYNDNLKEILKKDRVNNIIKGFKGNKKLEELCKHCKFI